MVVPLSTGPFCIFVAALCVCAVIGAQPPCPNPNTLTTIEVLASGAYDAGYSIGFATALQIQATVNASSFAPYRAFIASGVGAAAFAALNTNAATYLPSAVDEMRGLAAGAGVDLASIQILNMQAELSTLMGPSFAKPHCTDILLLAGGAGGAARVVAHNEDNTASEYIGLMTFARVNYVPASGEAANYSAYMYPGALASTAWGWNSFGLVQTQNAVFPLSINTSGVALEIMARGLMRQPTIDAAIAFLQSVPCAGGFSVNLAQTGDADARLVNVEISPEGGVTILELTAPGDAFYHVNMYRHSPLVPQMDDTSSDARLARLLELPVPTTAAEATAMLGDTHNATWPIYRNGSEADGVATLITAVFTFPQDGTETTEVPSSGSGAPRRASL